jgi:ankyrin repeat protein
VNTLLEHGADVNAGVGPVAGKSALTSTVWSGHFGIVSKLLDLGADIDLAGSDHLSHDASSVPAQTGKVEMLNLLIGKGAKKHGSPGLLALEVAFSFNRLNTACSLLEHGIDVNAEFGGSPPEHSVEPWGMLHIIVANRAHMNLPCTRPLFADSVAASCAMRFLQLGD